MNMCSRTTRFPSMVDRWDYVSDQAASIAWRMMGGSICRTCYTFIQQSLIGGRGHFWLSMEPPCACRTGICRLQIDCSTITVHQWLMVKITRRQIWPALDSVHGTWIWNSIRESPSLLQSHRPRRHANKIQNLEQAKTKINIFEITEQILKIFTK